MPQSPYLLANISAVKNIHTEKLLSGKFGSRSCLILHQVKEIKILHYLFSSSLYTSKHKQTSKKARKRKGESPLISYVYFGLLLFSLSSRVYS